MRLLPIYFPHDLSACCGRQELAQKAQEFILCTGNINDCRVLFLHNTGDVPSNACRVHAVLLVMLHLTDATGDTSAVFIIAENAFLTCLCKSGADVTQLYNSNMDAVGLDFVCQSVRVRRNGGFACRVSSIFGRDAFATMRYVTLLNVSEIRDISNDERKVPFKNDDYLASGTSSFRKACKSIIRDNKI